MLIFANEIQTNTKMKMKKSIISFALMLFCHICISAIRNPEVRIEEQCRWSRVNSLVILPKKPTGRAVVDCPGGGYSHLAMDHEGISGQNISISRVSLTLFLKSVVCLRVTATFH